MRTSYRFKKGRLILDQNLIDFGITKERISKICEEFNCKCSHDKIEIFDPDLAGKCAVFLGKIDKTENAYLIERLTSDRIWENEYVAGRVMPNVFLFLSLKSSADILRKYGVTDIVGFINYLALAINGWENRDEAVNKKNLETIYWRAIRMGSAAALETLALSKFIPGNCAFNFLIPFCYLNGNERIENCVESIMNVGHWEEGMDYDAAWIAGSIAEARSRGIL